MDTLEIIRLTAKEFDKIDDSTLLKWIELTKPFVSRKKFGKLYEQALALLVCHKLKMAGFGDNPLGSAGVIGTGFAVSSISEGGVSISYGASQSTNTSLDAELGLTVYGTQFLQLRRQVVVPISIR
jgi:hypothetical protein